MSIKNEIRKKYKQARKNISEKRSKDKLINEFLCNMECYKSCDTVLFYAALDDRLIWIYQLKLHSIAVKK